jgi:predicted ester cyclase
LADPDNRGGTVGELVEVVKQHYANMSAGDTARDRDIMREDVMTVAPGAGTLEGIEAFIAHENIFTRAFPDAAVELVSSVESGDMVMTEGFFTGTHTGPLASPQGEIPPTGKSLRLPFADVFAIRDGKIAEHRIYYDQIDFLTQLGLAG